MKNMLLIALLLSSCVLGYSQNEILGKWKTIDDNTGKARSIVEIYKTGNTYTGKIIQLFREPEEIQDPVCDKCEGDKKGKKVIGLEIITDLAFDDAEWEDGTILDPENGKTYDCKIWIEDAKLQVRGYIAFFYRTQTWMRFDE
jgi:uncharacterized protein (DUF2147 family)